MFEDMLDGLRKTSESSFLAHQEMLKQWFQQWPAAPAEGTLEEGNSFQKRWTAAITEILTKQRELFDSTCSAGIKIVEQTTQLSAAKSPDDYRRGVEELLRKVFELIKLQSEAQVQQLLKMSRVWIEPPQPQ